MPTDATHPRVLVVDDDPGVLQTYLLALEEYSPLQADDGVAARDILTHTEVDIVVCDLGLPRLNGLDLMRWAREHCPHPLWIIVSGQDTFDAAVQALKLGAFDFICKPMPSLLQLETVVANAARNQALVRERAALARRLAENSLRLAESLKTLEAANTVLVEQQAMLDQDLQRAERILRALLPRTLRSIEQMQVNVAYRPSKAIGGDLYGAAMLDDRHLAVYVADAAGHGVSAALLAVLFNQRLSLFDPATGARSPATVLSELNRGLLEECRASGLFVTAVYALIDTVARTATLASAGHPPALLLRSTGISEPIEKTGPALGLVPDARYEVHDVVLAEGDRLLLYTDGLTDAMSTRSPSLDAVLSAVASHAEDGGEAIDHLLEWTTRGGSADDDMTLVLVTARSGVSTIHADRATTHSTAPADCPLLVGSDDGTTWVVIRGRATWKHAPVLHETCIEALDAGRSVVVDLASCTMLDSTVLGTLHELVVRAEARRSLHIQGVREEILRLFVELAMIQVLAAVVDSEQPAPAGMTALRVKGDAAAHGLVLHAHELLAELSPDNAEQFGPVVDALRREAAS